MSRIGLKPIEIPEGVDVKINDGNFVEVKGPKGTLSQQLCEDMTINIDGNTINVARPSETKRMKSLHGLTRTLLANMIEGVTQGYTKTLLIEGTGYRAAKAGNKLNLNLGFSHPIELEDPEGITVEVPDQHKIIISGIDKQAVGNFAAVVRDFRRPEPYKGKGVRYEDEHIRRKVGKTGK
ncbi:MAG: 50S ribosomal protein L6 [Tissierellia bacterium]|nr:50S ribosomal protein L6 [Tissierellia bacterium]